MTIGEVLLTTKYYFIPLSKIILLYWTKEVVLQWQLDIFLRRLKMF